MNMSMKFVEKILKKTGLNKNRLAKELKCDRQLIDRWIGKAENPARGMQMRYLSKLREISGFSWEELGKEIDGEFREK